MMVVSQSTRACAFVSSGWLQGIACSVRAAVGRGGMKKPPGAGARAAGDGHRSLWQAGVRPQFASEIYS